MESIQTTLSRWLKNREGFQQSLQEIREQLLSSPNIQKFLAEHPELTRSQIDQQLIKLYEYESQSKACEKCDSLEQCCNVVPGFAPDIYVENNRIKLRYSECPRKLQQLATLEKKRFVQSLHMPKEIFEASFETIDHSEINRVKAIQQIQLFLEKSKTELPSKGLYLHGNFGVGKTYLLAALANELAKIKIDTFFIYMPELVREMKASINDSTINEKIEKFKNASVLVLDDIGAEYLSPWFRDEVLGAILQYRMMERLPVFFTSNYSPDELKSMLAQTSSNKGDYEELKAARIMERIYQVSEPIEIQGPNYRNH